MIYELMEGETLLLKFAFLPRTAGDTLLMKLVEAMGNGKVICQTGDDNYRQYELENERMLCIRVKE